MIGGILPDHLPSVFPNLAHIGLDHCSFDSSIFTDSIKLSLGGVSPVGLGWLQNRQDNSTGSSGCSKDMYDFGTIKYKLNGSIPMSWSALNTTLQTL